MKGSAAARVAFATVLACLGMQSSAFATRISLTPDTDHPGATVAVKGSHFAANEAVDVYFDSTDELLVATNGKGVFRNRNLPVPSTASPGTHWVTAIGRTSGLAAQAAITVSTDWAMYGFGANRNSYNPYENVLSPDNVSGLTLAWSDPIGEDSYVNSSPAIAGGVLYVGVHDAITADALLAFDASSGAQLWAATAATGFGAQSSPVVANGAVYIGAQEQLYAYDAATGSQLWVVNTTGEIYSSPTVVNGVVYVGATNGDVYAFNASTGSQLWAASTGYPIFSSPAVANGVVYIGGEGYPMVVFAFNASTGALLWQANTNEDAGVRGAPAVAKGIVYFGTSDYYSQGGDIIAYNASTGSLLWSGQIGAVIDSTPAVANGLLYVETEGGTTHTDNYVCALNASIGGLLWCTDVGAGSGDSGVIDPSPAVANGVVYVASYQSVYALDAFTGSRLWKSPDFSIHMLASPVVANGMVYVDRGDDTYKGTLYAFALGGGRHGVNRKRRAAPDVRGLQPDWGLKLSF